jgi:hypothetical protein
MKLFQFVKTTGLFFTSIFVISGSFCSLTAKPAINDTVLLDETKLILNGAGYRSAYGLRMYTGGLYLISKNSSAQSIIDDNTPMAVLMVINSSLITGDRLEKSTREGFVNATGGNITLISEEIDTFLKLVKTDLKKGDVFLFAYQPVKGTSIIKNNKIIGVIEGLPFKKALFGIWLCAKPPQQELKKAMLGL